MVPHLMHATPRPLAGGAGGMQRPTSGRRGECLMAIRDRDGKEITVVRRATVADVKEFEGRKVTKKDRERTNEGMRWIFQYQDGKQLLADTSYLRADGGNKEIEEAIQGIDRRRFRILQNQATVMGWESIPLLMIHTVLFLVPASEKETFGSLAVDQTMKAKDRNGEVYFVLRVADAD